MRFLIFRRLSYFSSQRLKHLGNSNESGVILLLFVVGIFLVSSTLFLTVLNNNRTSMRSDARIAEALSLVKERLVVFATLSQEHYGVAGPGAGHLFCPDTNGNGSSNSPCGANSLGRLPLQLTTALGDIELSSFNAETDEQFWYSLDDSMHNDVAAVFNSATIPNLTLDGVGGIVAVLIAPNEAVLSQTRPSSAPSNYLEAGNTLAPDFFTSDALLANEFNDRVLAISFQEVITPVTARVAEAMKLSMDTYHGISGSYPDDSSFDDPAIDDFATVLAGAPAWIAGNDWLSETNYVRLTADSASLVFNGCAITYTVSVTGISRGGNRC